MKDDKVHEGEIGRRDLLRKAGAYTIGAAGLVTIVSSAPGCRQQGGPAAAPAVSAEKWPWPYEKLDPQKTADIAYEEWYRVYCGAAIINAVFGQLREKVGEPYKSFPNDAFVFLEGGVSGWGTICGSTAGVNVVTNCILGPRTAGSETGMLMGSELMQHYASTAMPTYVPKQPKVTTEIPKTVADSPLCHISVGKWMKAANKPLGSAERKDRCARLTASMAYQLVTLLNDWKDGKYVTKGVVPAKEYAIQAQHNCNDCHGTDVPSPPSAT
jgi:hypothetical protein